MQATLSQAPPAPRLSGRPRRRASRYSRFVGLMRFVLPATALVLIALLMLWPRLMGGGGLIAPMFVDAPKQLEQMQMRQPRYVGQTSEGRPFTVHAETAETTPTAPDRIQLDRLVAQIDTQRRDLELAARSGVYRRDDDKLDLAGGIEVLTSDGYRLETESARVLLQHGRIIGQRPITGTGPAGELRADRFEIRNGGDVLRFEGRVKVTLPQQTDGGASS